MPHQLVPWYLILSYLYYERDASPVPDSTFDFLARRLDNEWELAKHPHRKLLRRGSLQSGHYLAGKYPLRTRVAAIQFLLECLDDER